MGEVMKLIIDYDKETDILWLSNGQPTPDGEDIAEHVTAFFANEGKPNGVMIEHAAELLGPMLAAALFDRADARES